MATCDLDSADERLPWSEDDSPGLFSVLVETQGGQRLRVDALSRDDAALWIWRRACDVSADGFGTPVLQILRVDRWT